MRLIKSSLIVATLIPLLIFFVAEIDAAQPQGRDKQRSAFDLEQYRGRVVLLDFWASWCGPCREAFPWLNEMHRKYHGVGLEIIGINLDEARREAEQFLTNTPAEFTIYFDPKGVLAKRYDLQGMPASYLIGMDGRLLVEHTGFFRSQAAEREAEIRQALNLVP
ncbi:MAG: redoxin domain-containing protein [Candidatus Thiodiazotropha lotti]|uniref:Redoxin domain-containing protein n=1 Tax=Candidatus Thiodiazotropha lotti TaxID=2792787 RepID=A0A9E4N0B7_9GAMM|nr:redoxin domain-containing protein [Candidatus Thiodiazotropha lotti]MCG7986818.1 redoxin domain-containing protein [Candidatus Thiodiazotropha lotti]MCG8011697.1 redoxin domain-containing protein [Candidatus Thiodiazotropha lotti]MCG8018818.1 redoxin domain-containing protein [Candidatus Thiodiazotropha lotti]MCW4204856.1 redoxin domain-containing protein [Candidatus Thiodiazotropha lotti]